PAPPPPPPPPPSAPPPAEPEPEPEPEIFEVVENMPEPIGGIAAIQSNIQYPEMARRAGIEGRVFVQFVVDEQGRPSEIRVVRGIGGGCDEAAVEAVRQARFTPGRQRGRPVKVRMSLPVTFRLTN
ncbi:MAG: energy transducer TonB, partial [Rhodothermaceae bacterium]|nr:energy transducer TonB [Rhodothermaceae bacterium]